MSENEDNLLNDAANGSGIVKKLRDPIWQFIGAVLALIALFIPVIVSFFGAEQKPDNKSSLIVFPSKISSLDMPDQLSSRAKLLIDGKEEKDVQFETYRFLYVGNQALRKNDFEGGIKGILPRNRKIIGVKISSTTELFPYYGYLTNYKYSNIYRNSMDERSINPYMRALRNVTGKRIEVEFEKINDSSFEIKPLLMNPQDWFSIDIYTSAVTEENQTETKPANLREVKNANTANANTANANTANANTSDDESDMSEDNSSVMINWKCRIASVVCPAGIGDLYVAEERSLPAFLDTTIKQAGWGVYFIVFFNSINLIIFLILIINTNESKSTTLLELGLFFLSTILILGTGEIFADWIFNGRGPTIQPFIASVVLSIYILCLIAFIIWVFVKRLRTK